MDVLQEIERPHQAGLLRIHYRLEVSAMRNITAVLAALAVFVLRLPTKAQKPNPADSEVQKVALTFWDKLLTKCGDSYYWGGPTGDGSLRNYKEVSFGIVQEPVSQADQMNGVEWHGFIIMVARVFRTQEGYGAAQHWEPWRDGPAGGPTRQMAMRGDSPSHGYLSFFITKTAGHWGLRYADELEKMALTKPSCSAIAAHTPAK
jgi:hypothetical protein